MVRFNVPPTVGRKVLNIDNFRGVDLTSSPTQVSLSRSPEAINMIRDSVGSIRKRMGYEKVGEFSNRIQGVYTYNGETIIHVGRRLFDINGNEIADTNHAIAASSNFVGFEMGGKLYIKGVTVGGAGTGYFVYDGETIRHVSAAEVAYVPHVFAGKGFGGGTALVTPQGGEFVEPFNLIGYRWSETFGGDMPLFDLGGSAFADLARNTTSIISVEILQSNGEWEERPANASTTPGNPHRVHFWTHITRPSYVLLGEDWLRITAEYRPAAIPDNVRSFTRTNIIGFSGVNGARNVALFTGDSENPNRFFYSKEDNPTYVPDTNFTVIGEPNSAIMGFSTVDGRLAVHKDGREDVAVYMCQGEFDKGDDGILKTIFRTIGSVKGDGAISRRCFSSLDNDPLFLTRNGVFSLTARDIMGGIIAQSRSYFVNGALRNFSPDDLATAHACIYRDFYMLCVGGQVYVLDGLQKSYERNEPQSAFQYECYVLDNIKADFMWTQGDDLYFAHNSGGGGAGASAVYKFFSDSGNIEHFNDDGEAIESYWDLPELYGNLFYRKKTFIYLAVQLDAAIATGLELWAQVRGFWRKIGENFVRGRYFSWSNIKWSRWTWSTDRTTRTLSRKFRIKKVDKARYRLMNRNLNEPFAIYSVALEYTENGKYQR
ncbi:MAG: hypothetical protein FWE04_02480 [Oscillospiraceae bacterium]|nr:hypothetical protein [Oscillospiraceae bacterium]